jgi:hypothetical protein
MNPDTTPVIDRQFEQYNQAAGHTPYRYLLYPAIIFFAFGLLAVIWAIPFPQLAFLGRYNGFINWASFLIAGIIYYYLRLSPVVSYVLLLLTFAFSYGIIQLEKWQQAGGPYIWVVGLVLLLLGAIAQLILMRKRTAWVKILLTGPVWLIMTIVPARMRKT